MVNHAILIDKLKFLGFDSNSIEWMKSYLRDRRQKVEVNGKTSTIKILGSNSTTQGTVLAGILYLLYTLDFPAFFHNKVNKPTEDSKSKEAVVITFVDDSNSTIKEKDNEDLINTMTKNLKQTESYTSQNDLTLNCTKTKIFTLTKDNKIANGLNFHLMIIINLL